jgi:hypothetical protein
LCQEGEVNSEVNPEEPPAKRRKQHKSWSETHIIAFFEMQQEFGLDLKATWRYVRDVLPKMYEDLPLTTAKSWKQRLERKANKRAQLEQQNAQVRFRFCF